MKIKRSEKEIIVIKIAEVELIQVATGARKWE